MDPVPDPLLLRKSGSAGNRTRTSGSIAWPLGHRGDPSKCVIEQLVSLSIMPNGQRLGYKCAGHELCIAYLIFLLTICSKCFSLRKYRHRNRSSCCISRNSPMLLTLGLRQSIVAKCSRNSVLPFSSVVTRGHRDEQSLGR
jgi:hypothetical protein